MSKTLIYIPARMASKRLPGKPLKKIAGKTILEHCTTNAIFSGFPVTVVTHDIEIVQECERIGVSCMVTPEDGFRNGTERVAFAVRHDHGQEGLTADDLVINVQGDIPFFTPDMIRRMVHLADRESRKVGGAHIYSAYHHARNYGDLKNSNVPKVVMDSQNRAQFFSRSHIPFFDMREFSLGYILSSTCCHIGIYGYRPAALQMLAQAEPCLHEKAEKLEQLRFLHYGFKIKMFWEPTFPVSINCQFDLIEAKREREDGTEN